MAAPEAAAPDHGGAQDQGRPLFEEADCFTGAREGMVFKMGCLGLGYYLDSVAEEANNQIEQVRPLLPERWRGCNSLRQERLRLDPVHGAGLSLEHHEFGFKVTGVDDKPGQKVNVDDDVIVAMEGRVFAGLSAPQLQASFLKRRVNGARMQIASIAEVTKLKMMGPSIVESWDAQHQVPYYFCKKTGRSAWTLAELQPESAPEAAASSSGGPKAAAAAPIDLASFMSHGFAKPKDPPKKKRKVEAKPDEPKKDESDLARLERERWKDWNAGERGGYTDMFLNKYKNCQSNPAKPKDDKRLKGSVGPGQGMEYMARWTGSNNSFN